MPGGYPLFINQDNLTVSAVRNPFINKLPTFFDSAEEDTLEVLVHQVTKDPRNLVNHLQRIYFCYFNNQSEQLNAALIDLCSILLGKGRGLSQRMITGCQSVISATQFSAFRRYLESACSHDLPNSQYAVLHRNMIGSSNLIAKVKAEDKGHDFMQLAHDYIEYSQLESAVDVLERGVREQPDREDIQALLLELYRSTEDVARFRAMYETVLKNNQGLIKEWERLNDAFGEQTLR